MKHFKLAAMVAAIALMTVGAAMAADAESMTEDEKVFYYLGTAMSANLAPLNLTDEELNLVERGLRDALQGTAVELDAATYGEKLNTVAQTRMAASAVREETASREYLERMAAEPGAVTTESGIVIVELESGSGESPTADSTVTAHYHGTLRDGTVFDSSRDRGTPTDFALNGVIPCFSEALQAMKVGGKSKVTCAPALAYGDRGVPPDIPPGATLVFEVELLEIVTPAAAQPPASDLP